jgi:hypothetical protein
VGKWVFLGSSKMVKVFKKLAETHITSPIFDAEYIFYKKIEIEK